MKLIRMGIFAHVIRLPRKGREARAYIKYLLWKQSFHSKFFNQESRSSCGVFSVKR